MLKKIFTTGMLLALIGTVAQADTIKLGYSSGIFSSSTPVGSGFGDNEWVEEAIRIPASTMKTLTGARITAITGCLPSVADVSTVRIWVKTDLEGEPLAEFELVPNQLHNIKKGYNNLSFKTPWEIPADFNSDLYIGFGHKIKSGNARGISATETPMPGGFFLRRADGKWYDFSDRGTACIEAQVEGDNLPAVNLNLGNVTSGDIFVAAKKENIANIYVQNFGTERITGFDVTASCGTIKDTRHQSAGLEPGEMGRYQLTFNLPDMPTGEIEIAYSVENVNASVDSDPYNNSATVVMQSVSHDFPRYVLSEEFTTELCGNCPEVVKTVHNLLEKPEYSHIIQVCHHAGYKTDFLTEPWHETFTTLFGGGTFAPGLAVDRALQKPGTIVFFPETDDMITDMWEKRLATPAVVSANISARYTSDDESEIEVTLSGEKSIEKLSDSPCVNIMLLESGIPQQYQANAYAGFVHDYVSRAVSAADYWGDAVEFDGDTYTMTCTMKLEPAWNKSNMQIVAYIGNNGSWSGKEIHNAARMNLSEIKTGGIDSVMESAEIREVRYFDLTGRPLHAPVQGIVIKQILYDNGNVRTIKSALK